MHTLAIASCIGLSDCVNLTLKHHDYFIYSYHDYKNICITTYIHDYILATYARHTSDVKHLISIQR